MCKKCETNSVYEFTNKRKLCSSCFIRYFDKKFLYINRKFNLLKKGDVVLIKGKGNAVKVLNYVLNKFKDKLQIKISNKNYNKIAESSCIDSEAEKFLDILINKNIKYMKEVNIIEKIEKKQIIKPLYLFTDEEILLYAKLNKIPFRKESIKKENISSFLNKLEKNHPEVKRAVINSFLEINN
jgi:hypothetical protein